jgi:large subunit ribosomal protein L6
MSRIGAKPVALPQGVTLEIIQGVVHVKGSKGQLQLKLLPEVTVTVDGDSALITRVLENGDAKARHGLTRNLIKNMVQGVSAGHERKLEIIGVGYKALIKGKILNLQLGFSHPVDFDIPEGIEIVQDEKNKNLITIKGIDKQLVGQVASDIRSLRPPEPYKGKGIRYTDEVVRRKPGKAAAAKGS